MSELIEACQAMAVLEQRVSAHSIAAHRCRLAVGSARTAGDRAMAQRAAATFEADVAAVSAHMSVLRPHFSALLMSREAANDHGEPAGGDAA